MNDVMLVRVALHVASIPFYRYLLTRSLMPLLASRFSLLASRFSLLASRFSLLASRFSPLPLPLSFAPLQRYKSAKRCTQTIQLTHVQKMAVAKSSSVEMAWLRELRDLHSCTIGRSPVCYWAYVQNSKKI